MAADGFQHWYHSGYRMDGPLVVLDTNVVVAALRSRRGAAFRVVSAVGGAWFDIAISVPLVLEYEAALVAQRVREISESDIRATLDYRNRWTCRDGLTGLHPTTARYHRAPRPWPAVTWL